MAPANALNWSEPSQEWRYPKFCPSSGRQNSDKQTSKSTVELRCNEQPDTAYKKICKFLRNLRGTKKRKFLRIFFIINKVTLNRFFFFFKSVFSGENF